MQCTHGAKINIFPKKKFQQKLKLFPSQLRIVNYEL